MCIPLLPNRSARSPRSRALTLLMTAGLLLLTAAAAHGQGANGGLAEPASTEVSITPVSYVFDPAKATSVRRLGGEDPAKLPGRKGDKQPTPGWTTIIYETVEGAFPNVWTVNDTNPASGLDFWDDVSCRSFAGSWSAWCADEGNAACTTYDNNMMAWMILGPFSLADAIDAQAEFRVWSQTEMDFDHFSWLASANGTNFSGFQLSGNTGGWLLRTMDFANVPVLGDLRGDPSVWFAFVFESDFSVVMEGSYVDEIVVEKLTTGGCVDDVDNGVVCLNNNRFEFTMEWANQQGATQRVFIDKYTDRTALVFLFAGKQDIVYNLKALEGCVFNNHWWIWFGGAAGGGAAFTITVRDTLTGVTETYFKPFGVFPVAFRDDTSFPCP